MKTFLTITALTALAFTTPAIADEEKECHTDGNYTICHYVNNSGCFNSGAYGDYDDLASKYGGFHKDTVYENGMKIVIIQNGGTRFFFQDYGLIPQTCLRMTEKLKITR